MILPWVATELFLELVCNDIHNELVDVSGTEVSVAVVGKNLDFTLVELGDVDGELGVTEVNEGHIARILI